MEKMIYKYSFSTTDRFGILMPEGAEILAVQMQRSTPCIWAKVDPENKMKERFFRVIGTGHPFTEISFKLKHIGTYQEMNGALVFHLFEEESHS